MPLTKKHRAAAFALAIALVMSGCGKTTGKSKSPLKRSAQRMRAVIVPQPKSLIPLEGDIWADGQFTDLIFSNLVNADYLGALAPELASSWEISPDLREYTFHLRRNARFHDGRPLTSADVVFTLEKLAEKAWDRYAEIRFIDGIDDFLARRSERLRGVQALDAHTVRIRLQENFKFFLQFLAAEYTAIVPKDYAGLSEEEFRAHPVGTGPFRLAGTQPSPMGSVPFTVFKFERNPGYFAAMGNVEAIDFYAGNGAIDPKQKYRFDLLYISENEIRDFAGKPEFRVINSSPTIINFLVLNPKENAWMRERNVRRLINYGINREDLVRQVFHNQARPAHSMMPFGLLGYNPYYRLDYSRAADIRAGMPPGRIPFTIMTVAMGNRHLVAEFIARALAPYGLDAKVITVSDPFDYFTNRIYQTDSSIVLGGIPDYPSSYHFLSHLVEPNGYYNIFELSFPGLNDRIHSLPSLETVREARMLAEISAAFEDDSFYIPLYYNSNFIAINDRIETIVFKYGEITDFTGMEVAEP